VKIASIGMLAAAMALAACAAAAPVACELIDLDSPPLTCDAAVSAARPRLATTIGVTELRFQDEECAPDAARCPFLFGTAGNVIATLGDGREVAIFVSVDDEGSLHAEEPRAFVGEERPTPLP
jgi:hypothetical protein